MLELERERVRANVQAASTEDLLDRATVFRAGMEPEALLIIDEELHRRGVTAAEIADHRDRERERFPGDDVPLRCHECSRPAIGKRWRWRFGWLFPRRVALCEEHANR
jgi:hypothetical protein